MKKVSYEFSLHTSDLSKLAAAYAGSPTRTPKSCSRGSTIR